MHIAVRKFKQQENLLPESLPVSYETMRLENHSDRLFIQMCPEACLFCSEKIQAAHKSKVAQEVRAEQRLQLERLKQERLQRQHVSVYVKICG
jgi:hypothetical protein